MKNEKELKKYVERFNPFHKKDLMKESIENFINTIMSDSHFNLQVQIEPEDLRITLLFGVYECHVLKPYLRVVFDCCYGIEKCYFDNSFLDSKETKYIYGIGGNFINIKESKLTSLPYYECYFYYLRYSSAIKQFIDDNFIKLGILNENDKKDTFGN